MSILDRKNEILKSYNDSEEIWRRVSKLIVDNDILDATACGNIEGILQQLDEIQPGTKGIIYVKFHSTSTYFIEKIPVSRREI